MYGLQKGPFSELDDTPFALRRIGLEVRENHKRNMKADRRLGHFPIRVILMLGMVLWLPYHFSIVSDARSKSLKRSGLDAVIPLAEEGLWQLVEVGWLRDGKWLYSFSERRVVDQADNRSCPQGRICIYVVDGDGGPHVLGEMSRRGLCQNIQWTDSRFRLDTTWREQDRDVLVRMWIDGDRVCIGRDIPCTDGVLSVGWDLVAKDKILVARAEGKKVTWIEYRDGRDGDIGRDLPPIAGAHGRRSLPLPPIILPHVDSE
jgi:hypothetical protein